MKTVNRKMLLSLLGIAVATPFLVIALVAGFRAIALADGLQGDLLVVVLGLASVVASLGEGRVGLKLERVSASRGRVDGESETDLRGFSKLNHGY